MTYLELRQKYPNFIYQKFAWEIKESKLEISFFYQIPPDLSFVHKLTFENFTSGNIVPDENLIFQLGVAEMFSYWKLTCSPNITIEAGNLSDDRIKFWHTLLVNGMGQYFFENKIDFSAPDFVNISSSGSEIPTLDHDQSSNNSVLIPIGGGKDSIVTWELLKTKFNTRPIIVRPASPASDRIAPNALKVQRTLDSNLGKLNDQGYLNGHIPYSAVLAFIFLLAGQIEKIPFIAVSNERSSDENNTTYLGQSINHQYSKSLEFETDLNSYIAGLNIKYFSFLRPLYELQISKLFSKMPQYLSVFRSCNKNQQQDSWCGHCPKCLTIAMTLLPWTSVQTIQDIFGSNLLDSPENQELIKQLTGQDGIKPFECVLTFEEAKICLEFILKGQTPKVKEFLARFGEAPNTPLKFIQILKEAYANS